MITTKKGPCEPCNISGDSLGIRTLDPLIKSQLLNNEKKAVFIGVFEIDRLFYTTGLRPTRLYIASPNITHIVCIKQMRRDLLKGLSFVREEPISYSIIDISH